MRKMIPSWRREMVINLRALRNLKKRIQFEHNDSRGMWMTISGMIKGIRMSTKVMRQIQFSLK